MSHLIISCHLVVHFSLSTLRQSLGFQQFAQNCLAVSGKFKPAISHLLFDHSQSTGGIWHSITCPVLARTLPLQLPCPTINLTAAAWSTNFTWATSCEDPDSPN